MKCFLLIVLLLGVFAAKAYSAVAVGFYNNPKNPGKCTIKENLVLSPGEKIKDPDQACGRIICGGDGSAEFQTCGVQRLQVEGCRFGDYLDERLEYPDCCKRQIICN